MMRDNQGRTGIFIDVPEELRDEVEERLHRMDQLRVGSIWPSTFEDGMRFVYLQLLGDVGRCKEIIEGYTRLRRLDHERHRIVLEFRKKYEEEARERAERLAR